MRGKGDADWKELVEGWKRTQNELRGRIVVAPMKKLPRFVAGADAAFSEDKRWVYAAAVVYDREEQRIVEVAHARGKAEVPYVPGFLSFREGPTVLEAIEKLKHEWGVICFDGQGYAHPRRCGIAAHLAVTLDRPGVGVGKSRLIGEFEELGNEAGELSALMEEGEQVGIVLRTKENCRPLFVSVAHRMDLESARKLVMACSRKFRVPEPTRQADIEVGKLKMNGGRSI